MNQIIIYPSDGGGIATVHPCDCGLTIEEIARKDTPAGKPFLIIDTADLPDGEYRAAWTADFSQPDGVGIGPDAWFAERAAQGGN
jgi:hypothetical protein